LPTNGAPVPRGAASVAKTAQRRPGPSADLQAFLQAFPNLGLFSASFSKESFGGFVGFQWVTKIKNQKAKPVKAAN
jgi:hypothetical protein